MSEKSWVLEAIEREAMARAHASAGGFPTAYFWKGLRVTEDQIGWLMRDYERRTGKSVHDIDPPAMIAAELRDG